MIRREVAAEGPMPARWVLISQIEHARLAGRLAQHWGNGGFAPLLPYSEVLWAVYHHDDGWHAWDQAPDVDPQRGWPRAFTEMRIDDSLAIWSASIDGAGRAGHLEGYLVAGHFCALARRAAAWHQTDPDWQQAARFIAEHEAKMQDWLAAWEGANPTLNTHEVARQALAHLQFFDSLSLWFCCAEATSPDEVQSPGGPTLTLVPEDAHNLRLSPWPLSIESLNLEVPGRMVPAGHFASREALAAAPSQPVLLTWRLKKGIPNNGARKVDCPA
jgi:hypothetical protein